MTTAPSKTSSPTNPNGWARKSWNAFWRPITLPTWATLLVFGSWLYFVISSFVIDGFWHAINILVIALALGTVCKALQKRYEARKEAKVQVITTMPETPQPSAAFTWPLGCVVIYGILAVWIVVTDIASLF